MLKIVSVIGLAVLLAGCGTYGPRQQYAEARYDTGPAYGPRYGQPVGQPAYDYSQKQTTAVQADPNQVGPNRGTYRCDEATKAPARPGNALCVKR